MTIKEINNKEIWEKFVAKYSSQSLFQSWSWGETIVKAQNAKIKDKSFFWRLGIYDQSKLVGIAQIEKVIARRGTFLHIRHGPIFAKWNKKYLQFLLDYLKSKAKEDGASFIRISPLIENSLENKKFFKKMRFLNSPIHAMDGELCWVLDIKDDENILLSRMRKTTRYLIRQAQKIGVEIVKTKDEERIKKFLTLYNSTSKRHKFVPHKGIPEEFREFKKDDNILLFEGYYQNKLLSAALILFYNNQAIYHHSASIEQKIPVNYLLQWEVIKEAKERGKAIYNFWGVAPEGKPRHPWKGHSLFKKGFGGREVEYLHAQDYPLSIKYCATYTVECFRRLRKGY